MQDLRSVPSNILMDDKKKVSKVKVAPQYRDQVYKATSREAEQQKKKKDK